LISSTATRSGGDKADGLDEARQQVPIATGRWRRLARPSGSRGTAASLLAQAIVDGAEWLLKGTGGLAVV